MTTFAKTDSLPHAHRLESVPPLNDQLPASPIAPQAIPYPRLSEPLGLIEKTLQTQLAAATHPMDDVMRHLGRMTGKRLRPLLVLLSANAVQQWNRDSITMGAAVELVHMATLVHDDWLDQAAVRRHLPTVHATWDATTAILAGDWLFTRAYRLCNSVDSTLPGRWLADAACGLCEGEMTQNHLAHRWDLDEPTYFQILAGKTGQLSSVSCRLGGWSCQASPSQIEALGQYGLNLGIAFQIFDDYLDYWGSALTGKNRFADLRAGKATLPTIFLWKNSSPAQRQAWLNQLLLPNPQDVSPSTLAEFANHLDAIGAKEFTLNTAQAYVLRAKQALEPFAPSDAIHQLLALADAVCQRAQ